MSSPLISVVIATYNRANDLDRAIKSVLAQPGDCFEVVIGDDASPDHTQEIIKFYAQDTRVRHYKNDVNLGMQENVLKAAKFAQGEYIFILTDDDYVLPGALGKVTQIVQSHPEAGYILSHLPTIDERTGQVVDLHRTFKDDRLIPPNIANMTHIVRSAWVLSRQVLKRELVDWQTWERFKSNIFFPMIYTGRLVLKAPCYYIADCLVMHTWFNKVYWDAFGRDQLEIEFNLALDASKCMRAILFDHEETPDVRAAIQQWEINSFKSYLYRSHLGFYDLIRTVGIREGLEKLRGSYQLNDRERLELCLFPFKVPFIRAWVNSKRVLRGLPSPLVRSFKSVRDKLFR